MGIHFPLKAFKRAEYNIKTQKTVWIVILNSEKIAYNKNVIKRDKECHFIMIEELIHQEYITV